MTLQEEIIDLKVQAFDINNEISRLNQALKQILTVLQEKLNQRTAEEKSVKTPKSAK